MAGETRAVLENMLKAIDAFEKAGLKLLPEVKLVILAAQNPGIAKNALAKASAFQSATFAATMSSLSERNLITATEDRVLLSDDGTKLVEALT